MPLSPFGFKLIDLINNRNICFIYRLMAIPCIYDTVSLYMWESFIESMSQFICGHLFCILQCHPSQRSDQSTQKQTPKPHGRWCSNPPHPSTLDPQVGFHISWLSGVFFFSATRSSKSLSSSWDICGKTCYPHTLSSPKTLEWMMCLCVCVSCVLCVCLCYEGNNIWYKCNVFWGKKDTHNVGQTLNYNKKAIMKRLFFVILVII